MTEAFKYCTSHGLEQESDYSYTGHDDSCAYDKSKVVCQSSGYKTVASNDDDIKAASATSPLAVSIEADQLSFQFFTGGIITSGCGKNLDHGVTMVGYGTDPKCDLYAIVKNSWGATWGEQGYVNICVSNDSCGI